MLGLGCAPFAAQGWLNVFGSGLGYASQKLPAAIFIMGFLSVALANTINNQPMTILLTRVALDPRYDERLSPPHLTSCRETSRRGACPWSRRAHVSHRDFLKTVRISCPVNVCLTRTLASPTPHPGPLHTSCFPPLRFTSHVTGKVHKAALFALVLGR